MTQMTGGEALIAGLAAHDVDTIFGIPGTHNLAAYAVLDTYGITHVSPRHEQGAGYGADGYARSSGKPGVVLTTTGPAILNAASAAAQAYSDSVPVLFVSPGMPLGHPGLGNGLLHEIKNQSAAMAAIVAYSHRVTSIEEIPLAIAQAFAAMNTGRPRPLHLEIPLDILDQSADVEIIPPMAASILRPAAEEVAAAARTLEGAKAPLLIVGGGAWQASELLVTLAESLGAPVLSTTNGKGTFPEDHPLFIGAGVQHPSVLEAVAESDCVLAIGTELAPSDWWIGLPDLTEKLIRIDIDGTSAHTNARAHHALVGDCVAVVREVLTLLQGDSLTDRQKGRNEGLDRADSWRQKHQQDARAEGGPWLEIISAIADALPHDAIVAADSAMACYYGALSNLRLFRPRSFLYPTGVGTLGYGLPAGIGAKVANPDAPVLVLQGDGGIMFTIAELATAAELGLALPIVIVDNGGYGEIRNEMADRGEPIHAVALGQPDFVALAKSLGCDGVFVSTATDLSSAVDSALNSNRPTVIHIREHSRASEDML